MNYSKAIWAYRAHISNWVNDILSTNVSQLTKRMNMYISRSRFPIYCLKVESANIATRAVMLNTLATRYWIAFVCVYRNVTNRPLK